ncbi:MAG: nucleoside-triphosphatase [Candidatus Bathyarchaeia archaeon]|jgi:nucleoside-triphosphatase THEP1
MHCAVILHAPIGGGKTTTAIDAAERASADGLKVMGILSMRVLDGGDYPSYDLLELDTGETMHLVKPVDKISGEIWESYDNSHFVFSKKGLNSANLALTRAAKEMRDGVVVFVDEYGRLESQHKGIYSGAIMVADALKRGGIAVYLCRDDKVNEVIDLVKESAARVFSLEAGDTDALLRIIRGCSKL